MPSSLQRSMRSAPTFCRFLRLQTVGLIDQRGALLRISFRSLDIDDEFRSEIENLLKTGIAVGITIGHHENLPDRPAVIGAEARTWVKELACTPPKDLPDGPTQALWSMDTLAEYVRKHVTMRGGRKC